MLEEWFLYQNRKLERSCSRMSFPPKVAEQALIDCGRHCCLCHKFCGTKIELHHIEQKADDGPHTYDNCIPLCFDCHADVNSYNDKHPKGRKYTPSELKGHRDQWYEKVRKNYGITANPDYLEVDRKLFSEIREVLPSRGAISFIRVHDYGGSFDRKVHDELDDFLYFCQRPECEFLDSDMEGLRARLEDDVKQFVEALAEHTFPLERNYDKNRIPRDPMQEAETLLWFRQKAKDENEFNELIKQQREHLFKVRHELNRLAQQVYNTYDEFIRFGRRKLVV